MQRAKWGGDGGDSDDSNHPLTPCCSDGEEEEGGGGGRSGPLRPTVLDLPGGDGDEEEEEEESEEESEEKVEEEEEAAAAQAPGGGRKRGRDGAAAAASPTTSPAPDGEAGDPSSVPAAVPAAPAAPITSLPTAPPPIPPPGEGKAALRVAWEAAYVRFLWERAVGGVEGAGAPAPSRRGAAVPSTAPPPESYSRGQHLRGPDADAADAACELLAAEHAAALAASHAYLADVKREMKAAVRRRLLGRLLEEAAAAGEAEHRAAAAAAATPVSGGRPTRPPPRPVPAAVLTPAVFREELGALLAAGGKVAPYGKGPLAPPPKPGGGGGGGPSKAKPSSDDPSPYKARRIGMGGFGGGAGSGSAASAALFAGQGKRLAAAEAVRRQAAVVPTCLAWSPPSPAADSPSFSSLLAIGTGDGRVWVWRCDHPRHDGDGGGAKPRFSLVTRAGVRVFGSQATACLAWAVPDAVAASYSRPPLVLVAGGGRGGVALLEASNDGSSVTRTGRLSAADGRPATSLAARLEKGKGGNTSTTSPWSLRIAVGKAGGRVAAWLVELRASLALPPPATAACGDGRTITAVAWLPSSAAADASQPLLYSAGEDGRLRLWALPGSGRSLTPAAPPTIPGCDLAGGTRRALRLPLFGAAASPGGFRIATVSPMAAGAAKDAGVSKTMTFAALERAGVGWSGVPLGREPLLASLADAAVAAAAGLRVPGGHATALLADLAASLRGEEAAPARTAALAALEGPVRTGMEGASSDLLSSSSSLSLADWTGLRRACALRRALAVPGPPPASGPKAGTGWLGEAGTDAAPPVPAWDGEVDCALLASAELALLARQARGAMGREDSVTALLAADWSASAPAAPGVAALVSTRPGLAATLAAGAASAGSTYRRLKASPPKDAKAPPAREGGNTTTMDGRASPLLAARRCGGAAVLPVPRCGGTWRALLPSTTPRVCRLCGRLAATPAPGDAALHAGAPVCGVCGVLTGPLGRAGGYGWPGLP